MGVKYEQIRIQDQSELKEFVHTWVRAIVTTEFEVVGPASKDASLLVLLNGYG